MATKRPITKRPTSRDPLQVQISVAARLPKGTRPEQLTAALIDEVIKYRIENGEDHPRFKTKIIRWKNPTRRSAFARWRQGNQADAWGTLAKWLKFARVDAIAVRARPSRRRSK
jgi:accessory colonization factor AcfC